MDASHLWGKGIQSLGAQHHLVVLCILPPEAGTSGCRKAVAQGSVGGVHLTCLSPYTISPVAVWDSTTTQGDRQMFPERFPSAALEVLKASLAKSLSGVL